MRLTGQPAESHIETSQRAQPWAALFCHTLLNRKLEAQAWAITSEIWEISSDPGLVSGGGGGTGQSGLARRWPQRCKTKSQAQSRNRRGLGAKLQRARPAAAAENV